MGRLTEEHKARIAASMRGNRNAAGKHNLSPEGREAIRRSSSRPRAPYPAQTKQGA